MLDFVLETLEREVSHYPSGHAYVELDELIYTLDLYPASRTPITLVYKTSPTGLSSSFSLFHFYFLSISARVMPPLNAFLARACWSCQRVRAPSTAAPSFAATIVV